MPDTPERKPSLRGRPLLRGRGRGAASTAAGPSTGRLASLRRDGTASPASSSVGAPSPPATKLKFTPNIPARRIKREPSTPKIETKPMRAVPKVEIKEPRQGRKRFELIERVTGPFAQGPASLSSMSGRNTGGAGGFSSITGAGVDIDTSRPELDGDLSRLDALIEETDHNKRARASEFEVQTEEMALKAFGQMSQLQLDYTAAQQFGFGNTQGEDSLDWAEDRLMVFQIPKLPAFEMDVGALQQLRSTRRMAQSPKVDMDVDVKPDIAQLETKADVKPNVQTVDSDDETDGGSVDGRIGTLVVLKSGAVKMKIGDILFDVTQGADCNFLRGLLAVDVCGTNSTAHLLGNIETQLLCTPDLDSIV
ncbi:DNA-directed RNA polymerase III subunit RPC4 [Coemansia sp. RSA 2131]|nr:DNA-directed RNA polymerase III subunit RPC4 [Coemansia sp. RSA 2131]